MEIRPHIFAELLHAAMLETYGWKTKELKSQCWWDSDLVDPILREAERLGYVRRPSTTQVEYTDKGVVLLHTNIPGMRERFEDVIGDNPWWCCKADFPNHEPTCENYGTNKGE